MKIVLVLSVILWTATKYATAFSIVCYYTNYAQHRRNLGKFTPDNIDAQLCDVIVYAFATLSSNTITTFEDNDNEMISSVVAKKQNNPNLKVLICIGGYDAGSKIFRDMASSSGSRQQFIKSAIQFMRTRNLDGLDLAWVSPANRDSTNENDKQLFITFLQEAKAAFGQYNLLLTVSVASNPLKISPGYEPNKIGDYIDWINLLAYDYHGFWDSFTGFNSPLYARSDETGDQRALNVDASVRFFSDNGFPKDKTVLGMTLYSRSFTLANAKDYRLGAPTVGPGNAGQYTEEAGTKSYYEVCDDLKNGFTSYWNADQKAPFMYKGNQWISYNNIQSLQVKANYVKSQGLRGASFFALDFDDFTGSFCNQGKYPLINAVKQVLSTSTSSPTPLTFVSTSYLITNTTQVTTTTKTTTISSVNNSQQFVIDSSNACKNYYLCFKSQIVFVIGLKMFISMVLL